MISFSQIDKTGLGSVQARSEPFFFFKHQIPITLNPILDEPSAINTSEENHLVTAVICHVVRPGREEGYEAWFHGIAADARKFKGHLGVNTIRPQDHAHLEYVVILKFDCYDNLKTDAGYQLITSVIFVITKRDFDYSKVFGSYCLGLGCDVVVEVGLGEGLVVSDFVSLSGLVSDNCVYPGLGRSFVPGGCNA